MKIFFILLLLVGITSAHAQINSSRKASGVFFNLFPLSSAFAYSKTIPPLTSISLSNNMFSSTMYWQGSLYTSYSENGRFRSAHSFDVLGNLRESKASFSLKKTGLLSYWRVQFSPQRARPQFTYTIH